MVNSGTRQAQAAIFLAKETPFYLACCPKNGGSRKSVFMRRRQQPVPRTRLLSLRASDTGTQIPQQPRNRLLQAPTTSFYDWQQRFATEEVCRDAIMAQRWPEEFRCLHCAHDHR